MAGVSVGASSSVEHGEAIKRKKQPESLYQGAHAAVAFNGNSTLFPGGVCAQEPKTV